MKTNKKTFLFLMTVFMFLLVLTLTSCLEVKQSININKDGSGEARLEVAVQKEWASQLIPKLKGDMPKGWSIIGEKEKEGKHVIVYGRKFKDISELNDDENRYTFSSERKGFLEKSCSLEVKQLKSSDMPFPYEVTIELPGGIDETDGTRIASGEVKWNLQGFKKGTKLSVKSSAFALPDFASLKESFNKAFNSVFYHEAIVFLRDDNLWVMDSDGKNQRQLTNEEIEYLSKVGQVSREAQQFIELKTGEEKNGFRFTEDGAIFYGNVPLYCSETNTTKIPVTYSSDGNVIFAQKVLISPLSPAGNFAFLKGCDGVDKYALCWALYLINLKEKLLKRTYAGKYSPINWVKWSSDETHGFLMYRDESFSTLYRIDLKTGDSKELFVAQELTVGDLSPDSKKIVFEKITYIEGNEKQSLWIADNDEKVKRLLIKNRSSEQVRDFSKKEIILMIKNEGILIFESSGSNLQKLADNASSSKWTSIPRISFVTPNTAKIVILVAIALTGILMLFGMVLLTRKAIKAVIPKIHKKSVSPRGIFCSQCGKENSSNASFCVNCGHKLH